ncbi:MAG: type II toxin-antitoxin system VapB family antitoxin [Deltaproteobacteria bacterium]|nr:type II toxin-antitoxin system VapB family antitoxin [Deltaproteobacteria bacterium]
MPLNIKNAVVEQLAAEIARLTGETKTESIRRALEDRRKTIGSLSAVTNPRARIVRFLESEAWPSIPRREIGRRWTRSKLDALLGFGKLGL